jgi:hypothetical protein
MCSYPPTDTLCPSNHACLGGIDSFSKLTGGCSTMCLSASGCGSGCTACGASTPICQINANGTTSSCVAATQGCNTIVQLGASVTPVFAPGQLGVGTQGTLLSGTYTLKTAAQYTAPGTPYGLYPEAETLTISVAGSNATFNSFQDYSTIGYQYRWTATVDTSAAPPVFKYTCITPPDGQPPLNTAQPFDYTVVNATTLVLFYPDNMGGGVKDTYTKQ